MDENNSINHFKNNVNRFESKMDKCMRVEHTPSVYFAFEESNLKSDRNFDISFKDSAELEAEEIPYEYSDTNYKNQKTKREEINPEPQTPPSYLLRNHQIILPFDDADYACSPSKKLKVRRALDFNNISSKVDTEEFFQDFENNFVVKFGDSPIKVQENLDFKRNSGQSNQSNDQNNQNEKIGSYISEPLPKDMYRGEDEVENQEISSIQIQLERKDLGKQNKRSYNKLLSKQDDPTKQMWEFQRSKIPFQVRKRINFKNQQNLANKSTQNKSRPGKRLINSENLMIVTSCGWGGWTGIPQVKKYKQQVKSHPIKSVEKTFKKQYSNIFSNHQMFKETLRSTTLDNWRKKFTVQKSFLGKKNKLGQNIFQKPFGVR